MPLKGRVVKGGLKKKEKKKQQVKAVNYREIQQVAKDYPNLLPAKQLGRLTTRRALQVHFFLSPACRQDGRLRSPRRLAAGAAEVRRALQT